MAARLYITTEIDPVPVSTVRVKTAAGLFPGEFGLIAEGYPDITTMFGEDPFYVAHRGGSADWDEMTLRAYTNSVGWGAGALEVSIARTSDGVWFRLHDEYLDRTSQVGGGSTYDPRTMTWAQVQQQSVFGRHPYMRLEELMELYGETHVIFVDPKYANRVSYNAELWSLLKTLVSEWQTRIVIKLYWNFNSGWGANAKAAGFKTWGYLWDDDGLATISSNHSNFDYLGFNYDASQGDWDTVLALGKPVIGHVCPDLTAAESALSKGAVGVMAAGVKSIVPPKLPWNN